MQNQIINTQSATECVCFEVQCTVNFVLKNGPNFERWRCNFLVSLPTCYFFFTFTVLLLRSVGANCIIILCKDFSCVRWYAAIKYQRKKVDLVEIYALKVAVGSFFVYVKIFCLFEFDAFHFEDSFLSFWKLHFFNSSRNLCLAALQNFVVYQPKSPKTFLQWVLVRPKLQKQHLHLLIIV